VDSLYETYYSAKESYVARDFPRLLAFSSAAEINTDIEDLRNQDSWLSLIISAKTFIPSGVFSFRCFLISYETSDFLIDPGLT